MHWVYTGFLTSATLPLDKYNGLSIDERPIIEKRSPKSFGRSRFENDPNGASASGRPGSVWHIYVCAKWTQGRYLPGGLPNGSSLSKWWPILAAIR